MNADVETPEGIVLLFVRPDNTRPPLKQNVVPYLRIQNASEGYGFVICPAFEIHEEDRTRWVYMGDSDQTIFEAEHLQHLRITVDIDSCIFEEDFRKDILSRVYETIASHTHVRIYEKSGVWIHLQCGIWECSYLVNEEQAALLFPR